MQFESLAVLVEIINGIHEFEWENNFILYIIYVCTDFEVLTNSFQLSLLTRYSLRTNKNKKEWDLVVRGSLSIGAKTLLTTNRNLIFINKNTVVLASSIGGREEETKYVYSQWDYAKLFLLSFLFLHLHSFTTTSTVKTHIDSSLGSSPMVTFTLLVSSNRFFSFPIRNPHSCFL